MSKVVYGIEIEVGKEFNRKINSAKLVKYTSGNSIELYETDSYGNWENQLFCFKYKSDFFRLIENSNFKDELVEYLTKEGTSDE